MLLSNHMTITEESTAFRKERNLLVPRRITQLLGKVRSQLSGKVQGLRLRLYSSTNSNK